jgi:hypothetical protein
LPANGTNAFRATCYNGKHRTDFFGQLTDNKHEVYCYGIYEIESL